MAGLFKRVFKKMEDTIINEEAPKFHSETDYKKPIGKATVMQDDPIEVFPIEEKEI